MYKEITEEDFKEMFDEMIKKNPEMSDAWWRHQSPSFQRVVDEKIKELVKNYIKDNP